MSGLALAAIPIFIFIIVKVLWSRHVHQKWVSDYPDDFEAYLGANPECKTETGIRCKFCGAESLTDEGWSGKYDVKRCITCNECFSKLYRRKRNLNSTS